VRIDIENFIKILTLFTLIKISEKYNIDFTMSIITMALSLAD
jgi:hypothetical protein